MANDDSESDNHRYRRRFADNHPGRGRRDRCRRGARHRIVITEHAATTERNRRLAPPALRAAGLFRLFTPRALGGLEVDPVTFARVVEEVSTFDSAAGWAFQVNTGAWWTSRMSPEGVAELYADGPDLMMAASFALPAELMKCRPVTESRGVERWQAPSTIPVGR